MCFANLCDLGCGWLTLKVKFRVWGHLGRSKVTRSVCVVLDLLPLAAMLLFSAAFGSSILRQFCRARTLKAALTDVSASRCV